jgi:hypothetical protein
MSVWKEMRSSRVQVALESVLLKVFNKPQQTLERKIIQSQEFRESVLQPWAKYCLNNQRAYTLTTIPELAKSKVGSALFFHCVILVGPIRFVGRVLLGSIETCLV